MSDRSPPRIGIPRPRPAPPVVHRSFTAIENRRFIAAVREESRLYRWDQKYMFEAFPDLKAFPALSELSSVALWHAERKPARHWLRSDDLRRRDTVLHDVERFDFRGAHWLWRLVERAQPLGLHLEVRDPYPWRHRVARLQWSTRDDAAA